MANPDHRDRLQRVGEWNEWRKNNATVAPDLREAWLEQAQLSGADLSGADLDRACLVAATLTSANLSGAGLVQANLGKATLAGANLSGADLSRAYLSDAQLNGADLSHAQLYRAELTRANLREAAIIDANFTEAELELVDFTDADLSKANFTNTALFHTRFQRTGLQGVNMAKALIGNAIFAAVDLSQVEGLEDAEHFAPSTIGIDTLYNSRGKIPEAFLRGAGVPDTLIAFTKSLTARPIEFYSCFISYSTKDQSFADRLHTDLQAKGVRCWFAPRDAERGRKLYEQIDEAIRMHEKFLLILSPNSINSNWVKTEIANARDRETREGVQMLFPVSLTPHDKLRNWKCFDADTGIDSAREIREYLIADFSEWKDHDAYQKEFEKLIRDLQSTRKTLPRKSPS